MCGSLGINLAILCLDMFAFLKNSADAGQSARPTHSDRDEERDLLFVVVNVTDQFCAAGAVCWWHGQARQSTVSLIAESLDELRSGRRTDCWFRFAFDQSNKTKTISWFLIRLLLAVWCGISCSLTSFIGECQHRSGTSSSIHVICAVKPHNPNHDDADWKRVTNKNCWIWTRQSHRNTSLSSLGFSNDCTIYA